MSFRTPYLMFLGDAPDELAAKTAIGVKDWRPEWCVGQFRLPGCQADLKLPDMSIAEGAAAGCGTLIVGIANRGGIIPDNWVGPIVEAIESGMDVASGLHRKLSSVPAIKEAAEKHGRTLTDVRHPTRDFDVASGKRRTGKRLLTIGTDVSVGKMYTSLAIWKELEKRGVKSTFAATGQTGIFIGGDGVSVDAVIADFIAGAAEWLSPDADPDHWHVVEGQGSLYHTSYAGVTLGLIHGSQPDALVICHDAARKTARGLGDKPLPSFEEVIEAGLWAARNVNPDVKVVGVSINTKSLDEAAAMKLLAETEDSLGLPTVDAVRTGVAKIVDNML
jgi:uncharacterized NAD-dependent epimerase/dehydratase family protein